MIILFSLFSILIRNGTNLSILEIVLARKRVKLASFDRFSLLVDETNRRKTVFQDHTKIALTRETVSSHLRDGPKMISFEGIVPKEHPFNL